MRHYLQIFIARSFESNSHLFVYVSRGKVSPGLPGYEPVCDFIETDLNIFCRREYLGSDETLLMVVIMQTI